MLSKEAENYVAKRGINQGRVILHSDLNNFFASVECLKYKSYKKYPIAVCGNPEERHGIVLAKNNLAKKFGVTTGQAVWQAKAECPGLVVVKPNYEEYAYYSGVVRGIYADYSDRVEPFGLDEAWVDISRTKGVKSLNDGVCLANVIRRRIYEETGLTVSIGVSDNKTFSKLASDYKKPDAVTLFGPGEYLSTISLLAVGEIMYVGRSSQKRLRTAQIETIGDVAKRNSTIFKSLLGKNGESLYYSACGYDTSEVQICGKDSTIKSIGNSATPPRDLCGAEDVRIMISAVCDKVCSRLRKARVRATVLQIHVRDCELNIAERQCGTVPIDNENDMTETAIRLYEENFGYNFKIRSVGVRAMGLLENRTEYQSSLFEASRDEDNRKNTVDQTVDGIRERYGRNVIKRGILYTDDDLYAQLYGGKHLINPFKQHSV